MQWVKKNHRRSNSTHWSVHLKIMKEMPLLKCQSTQISSFGKMGEANFQIWIHLRHRWTSDTQVHRYKENMQTPLQPTVLLLWGSTANHRTTMSFPLLLKINPARGKHICGDWGGTLCCSELWEIRPSPCVTSSPVSQFHHRGSMRTPPADVSKPKRIECVSMSRLWGQCRLFLCDPETQGNWFRNILCLDSSNQVHRENISLSWSFHPAEQHVDISYDPNPYILLLLLLLWALLHQESPQPIICLHLTSSSTSSCLTPMNFTSSFAPPINLLQPDSTSASLILIYSLNHFLCSLQLLPPSFPQRHWF